jgi:hypothetical protein
LKTFADENCSRELARGIAPTEQPQPSREQARSYKGTSEARSEREANMQTSTRIHDTEQEQGNAMNSNPNRGNNRKEKHS